jgi:hypothetical protein
MVPNFLNCLCLISESKWRQPVLQWKKIRVGLSEKRPLNLPLKIWLKENNINRKGNGKTKSTSDL